jgi:hypothetical protein
MIGSATVKDDTMYGPDTCGITAQHLLGGLGLDPQPVVQLTNAESSLLPCQTCFG